MSRIFFKDLSEDDREIVKSNRIYQTLPSGTAFQGHKSPTVVLSVGEVKVGYESQYDEDVGMVIGGIFTIDTI